MTERRNDLFAIVADGDRHALALRRHDAWTLPRWQTEGRMAWQRSAAVNDAVRALIGADVITLRVVYGERLEDDRRVFVYELAAMGEPTEAPARWLARDDVEALDDEEQRDLLARWFDEPDDERRVPWARPAWHAEAHQWIASEIEAAGRQVSGPPEQFGTSSISVVLRVPTDEGDVYFKAVPPLFGHEPALTRELEQRHGRRIVSVIATDESRGWMLTADHEGAELGGDDAEALRAIVFAYARIQIAWVGDSSRLAALGCPHRALDALEGELEPTLADDQLLSRLSPDERARLPALGERLRPAFDRLRTQEIPATLEHGDLHGGNLALRPDGPVFFDWTDGCVSVPFFSLVPLFVEEEPSDTAQLVRDAYLEPWFGEVPGDALVEAFELSQELGALHQAVSYRRIIDATELSQHWQFAPALPYFIRRLLGAREGR